MRPALNTSSAPATANQSARTSLPPRLCPISRERALRADPLTPVLQLFELRHRLRQQRRGLAELALYEHRHLAQRTRRQCQQLRVTAFPPFGEHLAVIADRLTRLVAIEVRAPHPVVD